jgi:hypothetical protein
MLIVHLYLIHNIIGYHHGDAQTRAPTVIISFKILLMIFHVVHPPTHLFSMLPVVCVCGGEIVI